MTARIDKSGLQVATELASFIEDRALPGTGITPAAFWSGLTNPALISIEYFLPL